MENSQIQSSVTALGTPLALALETSGRIGSIAIGRDEQVLRQMVFSGPMTHSREIFPAINHLLTEIGQKPADIGSIYISIGPGSFTGLRIAVTIAKIMHMTTNVKVVAVNTLDIIAQNASIYNADNNTDIADIVVLLDAKRGQFFSAHYNGKAGTWTKTTPDSLISAADFLSQSANDPKPLWLLGEGLKYHMDAFKGPNINFLNEKYWPARAEGLYHLAFARANNNLFADPVKLIPNYLCRPAAKIKSAK